MKNKLASSDREFRRAQQERLLRLRRRKLFNRSMRIENLEERRLMANDLKPLIYIPTVNSPVQLNTLDYQGNWEGSTCDYNATVQTCTTSSPVNISNLNATAPDGAKSVVEPRSGSYYPTATLTPKNGLLTLSTGQNEKNSTYGQQQEIKLAPNYFPSTLSPNESTDARKTFNTSFTAPTTGNFTFYVKLLGTGSLTVGSVTNNLTDSGRRTLQLTVPLTLGTTVPFKLTHESKGYPQSPNDLVVEWEGPGQARTNFVPNNDIVWERSNNFGSPNSKDQGIISYQAFINADKSLRDYDYGFRYTTSVTIPTTGEYTFFLNSNYLGQIRLNNETVLTQNGGTEKSFEKTYTAGTTIQVEILGAHDFGNRFLKFDWSGPSLPRQAFKTTALVKYEYFEGRVLSVENILSKPLVYSNSLYMEADVFQLEWRGQKTPLLKVGASAEVVQNAINNLSSIKDLGGKVFVTRSKDGLTYQVSFAGNTWYRPDLLLVSQRTNGKVSAVTSVAITKRDPASQFQLADFTRDFSANIPNPNTITVDNAPYFTPEKILYYTPNYNNSWDRRVGLSGYLQTPAIGGRFDPIYGMNVFQVRDLGINVQRTQFGFRVMTDPINSRATTTYQLNALKDANGTPRPLTLFTLGGLTFEAQPGTKVYLYEDNSTDSLVLSSNESSMMVSAPFEGGRLNLKLIRPTESSIFRVNLKTGSVDVTPNYEFVSFEIGGFTIPASDSFKMSYDKVAEKFTFNISQLNLQTAVANGTPKAHEYNDDYRNVVQVFEKQYDITNYSYRYIIGNYNSSDMAQVRNSFIPQFGKSGPLYGDMFSVPNEAATSGYINYFAINHKIKITVPRTGEYTFSSNGYGKQAIYVNGSAIATGGGGDLFGRIQLTAGVEYEVEFIEANNGTRSRYDMLMFIKGPSTNGDTIRFTAGVFGNFNGISSSYVESSRAFGYTSLDSVKASFNDAIDRQSGLSNEQKTSIKNSAQISVASNKISITQIPYLVKMEREWVNSYQHRFANPVKLSIPSGTISITKGKLDAVTALPIDSFEFGSTTLGDDLKFSTTFEPLKPSTAGGFKAAYFQRNTYNSDGSVNVPGNTFGIYGNQTQLPLDVAGVKLNGIANLGTATSPGVIITNANFVKLSYPVPEVTVGTMRYTASVVGSAKPLTVNYYPPIGAEKKSYVVQGGALLNSGSTLVSSDLKANFGGMGSDGLRIFPAVGTTPASFTFSFGVDDTFLVGTQAIKSVTGSNGLKLVYDPTSKAYNFVGTALLDFNPKTPHTPTSLEFTGTPLEVTATIPEGVKNFPANRLDATTLNFFFGDNAALNGFQFTPRVSNNPLRVAISSNSETIGGSFTMRLDNSYLFGVMDTTPFNGAKFPTTGFQLDFTPVAGQPTGFTLGGVLLDSARKATLTDALTLKFEKATFQGTELASGAAGSEPAIIEAKNGKITKAVITRNNSVQVGDIKFDRFVATYNLSALPAFWFFAGPGKYFNKTVNVGSPGANNPQLKIGGELGKGFQLKTINEPVPVLPPNFQLPDVIEVAGLKFETSELPQDGPVVDEGANGKTFSLKSSNYSVKLGNTTLRFNVGIKVKVDSTGVNIVSFSATGVQNSAFTIGNATFQVQTLTVEYVPTERKLNISGKAQFTFKAGSANVDMTVTLGTKADPGMVIKNGALESLKVTVDGTFELLKLSIAAEGLTIAYHKENSEFAIFGGVKISTASQGGIQVLKDLAVTLGSEETPGIKIVDGKLEALDIAINGDINLFKLTASPKDLRVRYNAAENQLQITGALSITFAPKLTLVASLPGDGLLIDTDTGKVQIKGIGLKAQSNISFGAMAIKGLHVEYEESSSGEVSISAGAEIELPSGLAVGGSFKIVEGKLEAISISFEKNPGILVANGLINIYGLEVQVEGLSNLDNFMFKGTVKATVGPLVKFGGEAYALADVTGSITITTKNLTLDGDVQLIGGHFGNGKFKGVLAWDNVARVTFDAEVNLYPGDVIRGKISAYADIRGNVDFNAQMGVFVPAGVPLAGGASLGQLGVELRIRPAEEPSASYAKFSFSDIAINPIRLPTFHGSARIGFDRLVDYSFGARFYIPLPWPLPDIDYSIDVGGRFELRDSDNPTVQIIAASTISGTPNAEILFASSTVLPDSTFVDIYADHDAFGNDGLLIASGIPYTAGTQSFTWKDMSTFANAGDPVYVYAVINDGTHPLGYSAYSPRFNTAAGFTPTIASPSKISFMAGDVATFAATFGNAIVIDDPRKTLLPDSEIEVILSVGHGMIDLSHAPDDVNYSGAGTNRLILRGKSSAITAALDGLHYAQEVATSNPDELTVTVRNLPLENLGIAAKATIILDPNPVSIELDADQNNDSSTTIEVGFDNQTPLANLNIESLDGEYLSGATVTIVGYEVGKDILELSLDEELAVGIESWFDYDTGTLNIAGFDWTIDYERALRNIVFSTTSTNSSKSLAISLADDNGEVSQTSIPLQIVEGRAAPELLLSISGTQYVEGSGDIQLDPESWLTVAEGSDIESIVVEFLGDDYVAGDDVLSYNGSNIQGTFHTTLGRLTLTGHATTAEWATALGQIRYESNAATFVEGYRYLRFTLRDNSGEDNDTASVDYIIEKVTTLSAHPAPTVTLTQTDLIFPANDDYIVVGDDLSLTVDAPNLLVAYVTISENYIAGEDELSVGTLWDGMTADFDTSTGTLTIRGTAGLFEYEDVLRSVYFVDHAGYRTPGPVEITFQVFDGLALSDRSSLIVNIESAPFLTADLDNVLVYELGRESDALGTEVNIEYAGSISQATIAFAAGYEADQDSLVFANQNGLTGQFDANTGILTIQGTASAQTYAEAIASISYRNSRYNPVAGDRVLSISVQGAGVESNEVYALISVEPEIVAPNVTLGSNTAFTENGAPVAIVPNFDLSQRDGTTEFLAAPDMLYGVEITIQNYVEGEDILLVQTTENITGEFDVTEGRIYLTGAASFTEYEDVLRTLEYRNTSDAPTVSARQISIRLLDSGSSGLSNQTFVTQVIVGLPDPVTLASGTITNVTGLQNADEFSLGLDDVTFTAENYDSTQVELRFTATSLPPKALGTVLFADETELEENVPYSLEKLQGLKFEPAPGAFGYADIEFSVTLYDLDTGVADLSNFSGSLTVTVEGVATITENQAFVAQIYRDLFDRNPNAAALTAYAAKYEEFLQRVDRSDNGYIDDAGARQAFIEWIETSTEYRTQWIQIQYADALTRSATSQELQTHLAEFADGATFQSIRASILGSQELFNRNTSQGYTSVANALYLQVFNRIATTSELSSAVQKLQNGTTTRVLAAQLMQQHQASSEAMEDAVSRLLRRDYEFADQFSFDFANLDATIKSIMASDEYFDAFAIPLSSMQKLTHETSDYPSVGKLGDISGERAGGTLVGNKYALVAAHSVIGIPPGQLTFTLGTDVYRIVQVYVHPEFDMESVGTDAGNDIAILELDRVVTGVTPSPILGRAPQLGEELLLVGYGEHDGDKYGTKRVGWTPPVVQVESNVFRWVHENLLQNDTDPGDSGSPLFISIAGQKHVVGIVSGGTSDFDGVGDIATNTRVDRYADWIKSIVTDAQVTAATQTPSLILEDDQFYLDENAGEQSIAIRFAGNQPVTVYVTSDKPTFFTNLEVDYDATGNGTIRFETGLNQRGSASIFVSVTAGNNSISRTIKLLVAERNDPPTLDAMKPILVDVGASVGSLALTGISAGKGETGTTQTRIVQSVPFGFFTDLTVLNGNTNTPSLRYQPKPNSVGSAIVYVEVRDAGNDGIFDTPDDNTTIEPIEVLATENAAPTLDAINATTLALVSGQRSLSLTGITDGDAEVQELRFELSTTDAAIANAYVVYDGANESTSGSLIVEPLLAGTATINVMLTDAGQDGLFDTQDDRSTTQTFVLTVVSGPNGWHNAVRPLDVNNDNFISAIDALLVINYLNRVGPGELPLTGATGTNYVDTTNDRFLNAIDALRVINYLNRLASPSGASGEGEGTEAASDNVFTIDSLRMGAIPMMTAYAYEVKANGSSAESERSSATKRLIQQTALRTRPETEVTKMVGVQRLASPDRPTLTDVAFEDLDANWDLELDEILMM